MLTHLTIYPGNNRAVWPTPLLAIAFPFFYNSSVPDVLLQTKFHIPATERSLIPRKQLHARLNEGLDGGLTLVCAPAGFGKTTLLSSWLSETTQPAAWLSLDELDNEAARFLRYFVAALENVAAVDPTLSELLQSGSRPEPHLVFTHLLNSLAAQPQPLILVLEDFHVISDQAVLEGLAFLVDHAPPGLNLVLTSRADPTLPLSRWRVRGQLHEIRAADLRFTRAETNAFLGQMGLTLTEQQAAALEKRTEGWAAGLKLAGLSLQRNDKPDEFVANFTGSHRYIMDYLTDEVLSQQPPEIESFLLQTSILDRFCAPLCDDLRLDTFGASGDSSSRQIIEQLESANLFLVALDDDRTWYRYHHLFADLLRERLKQKLPAETRATLHRRAARWFAAHDFIDEALTQASSIDEWDDVVKAIVRLSTPMLYEGRAVQVAGWLNRLPDAAVRGNPRLAFVKAWLLYAALNVTEIEPYLETALTLSDDLAHRGRTGIIHAWHMIATDDVEGGISLARELAEQLGESFPAEKGGLLTILSSGYFHLNQMEESAQTLEAALPYLERGQNWVGLSGATARLIRYYMMQGHLQQAYEASRRFMQQYNSRPVMQIGGGLQAAAFHALVLYERYEVDELPEAERLAARALELTSLSMPDSALVIWMRLFVALLKQMRGDVEAAHSLVEDAAAQLRQLGTHPALANHYDLLIRTYLLMERNTAVQEWLDRVAALDLPDDHATIMRNRIRQAQAVLQTVPEDQAALIAARKRLVAIVDAQPPEFMLMKAQAVLALVNDALGEQEAALATLEQALVLAAPQEWIQMFVYPGQRMASLLAQIGKTTAVPEFRAAVERALRTISPPDAETPAPGMVLGLLDPLTGRELEVLQLLSQGYTNREIANRLFIALGTTKRHIANIYSKMDVGNRTEAAVRARELGLLQE